MNASSILESQIIHVKKGRFNKFGFEPAWNSYFDFYISPKYIDPPLLHLEDVMFHLFLRKNLNDQNPTWKMPTVRQMMSRLSISYSRLTGMMERLAKAQLLVKESGYKAGPDGENVANRYILSDPIQTLEEFLVVASEGVFGIPLREEWTCQGSVHPCRENRDTLSREPIQLPIAEIAAYKQTLKTETEILWEAVLLSLKAHTPAATFMAFLDETSLSLDSGVATIYTPRTHAIEWLQRQMAGKIKRALNVELRCRDREDVISDVIVSCRHE